VGQVGRGHFRRGGFGERKDRFRRGLRLGWLRSLQAVGKRLGSAG